MIAASLSRLLRRGSCASSSLQLRRNPRSSVVAPSVFLFCRQLTNGSKGNDEALIKWLSGHTTDTTDDQVPKKQVAEDKIKGRPGVSRRTNDSDTRFLFDRSNDNPTQAQVDTYFRGDPDPSPEEVVSILQRAVKWKKKKSIDVLTGDKLGIVISALQRVLPVFNLSQLRNATVGVLGCLQVISPTDIEKSDILGFAVELLNASIKKKVRFTMIGISRTLCGLQNLSSDNPEVRDILSALLNVVNNCPGTFDAQAVGNALYGLQGMNSDHPEVRSLLVVLTGKVKACKEKLTAQHVGNALYGLQGMNSEHPEVRSLLVVLTGKVKACKDKLNAQEVGNALYGLQGMSSEHPEVRKLLVVLTEKVNAFDKPLTAQAVGNALYGLQGMSSEYPEVRSLLVVLTDKVKACKEKFKAQAVGNALYGLQGMSSEYPEVRSLLVVLTDKIKACDEPLDAQAVGNALYGLQGMSSDHPEVQKLLGALTSKVEACDEPFTAQHVSNAVYGLQGTDVDNEIVRALLSALKDKAIVCLEKNMCDHSTFDLLDLQRSFILFRHHIVAMFGSETLWSKYNSKLATELTQRRQQQDSFFTTRANFQSKNEKTVYNRVVALAAELQITDVHHNVFLLDCFESDITFTAPNYKGAAVVVNIEVDGAHHERQRKKTFCRRRDEELQRQIIHVARISHITDTAMIDNFLRKTVAEVLARQP